MEQARALPRADLDAFLDSLEPAEAAGIHYAWGAWARPKQRPPPGDWSVWMIRSGRGFGKTRTGSESVEFVREDRDAR